MKENKKRISLEDARRLQQRERLTAPYTQAKTATLPPPLPSLSHTLSPPDSFLLARTLEWAELSVLEPLLPLK